MSESEAETRTKRIDPRLKAAGWKVLTPGKLPKADRKAAASEYPTTNGPADYALVSGTELPIGVVEAKKVAVAPAAVLSQAERYSKGIQGTPMYRSTYGVPFLYSTNGEIIRFHDIRRAQNLSRVVSKFHTPTALLEMLQRDLDKELQGLSSIPENARLRPYQVEASAAIEQAIEDGKRRMLVTMATGTGKTLMTVNEVYRLMKSGIARRVLFLVDRRALAAQTVREFASFEAEPGLKFDKIYPLYSQAFQKGDFGDNGGSFDPNVMPNSLLTDPQLGDAFVYVSTIQRMAMNLYGGEGALTSEDDETEVGADQLDIPIHTFDLIIADECHRGYSSHDRSVWRQTLDHFDAIKVGLTATPAAHTMAYFENLEFRYDFERAVHEGYLVDYDVVKVKSDVRINGVFLKEGDQVDVVDPETGSKQMDLLDDDRDYDASKVEREITAPESNKKILQDIKAYADEFEAEHGRFPKMLIFAVNDLGHTSHADQLVDLARGLWARGEGFAQKITGKVDRPLQKIREFRNRPMPGIAVTVDLLTTGVDIPDLEFLVFLRPVKSRILFEQMLGRGTRLGGDKAPDKDRFVVFDCFDGTLIEYFRNATGITVDPVVGETKTVRQLVEEIWQNKDRVANIGRLSKRLQRIDKAMSGEAYALFESFIPDGDLGAWAAQLPSLIKNNFNKTMKILRDEAFLDLLENHPRGVKTFVIATGADDTVSSEWLIRGAAGKEYKPADYLQAFAEFVRDNEDTVDALSVLLSRPKDWNPETLSDLRDALRAAPDKFTDEKLERACKATHNTIADIISMVKHAASEEAPLLTAEQRVKAAIAKVTHGLTLTDERAAWMGYIEQHLVANLSIDQDDFGLMPVLSSHGGWGRANKVFDGRLTALVSQLNEELVAA
jgi:type I restriction enzyme R subunit